MSYNKIWIHAVWATKCREPVLQPGIHEKVCQHITENGSKKGYYIDSIDGGAEHLHALMTLNHTLSVSGQMQLIKGESSNWINKSGLVKGRFGWADDYYAETVSERNLTSVRAYIKSQKEHHKKVSFQEEYEEFIKGMGVIVDH